MNLFPFRMTKEELIDCIDCAVGENGHAIVGWTAYWWASELNCYVNMGTFIKLKDQEKWLEGKEVELLS